eukprot:15365854-Ditylum_brightwellii.AAC.3
MRVARALDLILCLSSVRGLVTKISYTTSVRQNMKLQKSKLPMMKKCIQNIVEYMEGQGKAGEVVTNIETPLQSSPSVWRSQLSDVALDIGTMLGKKNGSSSNDAMLQKNNSRDFL